MHKIKKGKPRSKFQDLMQMKMAYTKSAQNKQRNLETQKPSPIRSFTVAQKSTWCYSTRY